MRLLLTLALFISLSAFAQQNQWQQTDDGQITYHPFPHAPYPHKSRADGYKTKDGTFYSAAEHYSDSTVALFIPKDYSPRETVDYVVFFHGHRHNVALTVKEYNLPHLLVESKANAILVFPQGPKDVPDSGCGKLENDPGAFEALMKEITAYLVEQKKITTNKIGNVVISAHSGGYKVAACILDHGGLADHIHDTLLFDSSYGNLEMFAAWCAKPNHRLISFYTEHLKSANLELQGLLKQQHTDFLQLNDKGLTDEQVSPRQPIFITTDLKHDDVPSKNDHFPMTLRTSLLEK